MGTTPLALGRTPAQVLASVADEPGVTVLAVPDPVRPVVLVGCAPVDELRVAPDAVDPLDAIARWVDGTPLLEPAQPFPLAGGVVACLAYELGARIVPGVPAAPGGPLAVLGRYDALLALAVRRGAWSLVAARDGVPSWVKRLAAPPPPAWEGRLAATDLRAGLEVEAYRAAVARIHAWLRAGDVYQVNLTQPFTAPLVGPAWALWARLAAGAPYAAYCDLGHETVVAASPELFLRRRGAVVETQPIKGTRPRGATPAADAALVAELLADPKERAEHLMIVDLERNDLGRVATTGSVHVAAHAAAASHPTLHHLVSVVRAELRPDVGWAELLRATFPGGSITGAPKRRAMQIVAELEGGPRGLYTGAIGLLDPRGACELGLPIRTGTVRDGVLTYHAGGGIVVDSDADRELDECWLKTAAVRAALAGRDATLDRCSSG